MRVSARPLAMLGLALVCFPKPLCAQRMTPRARAASQRAELSWFDHFSAGAAGTRRA
jgi:hypothetical protein